MKATLYQGYYLNNKIFDLMDVKANRDNCLYIYYSLKEAFSKKKIDFSTQDINNINDSSIVIYNDMPRVKPKASDVNKSYLLLRESEVIRPDNYDIKSHSCFTKIFTWDDRLVDNKKYFKINFCFLFPTSINTLLQNKVKLCALIAGNKTVSHPLELYSKRVEAIRWFENNHPEDFDLYGMGWDKYYFSGPKFIRALNRIKPLTRMLAPSYPSYRGKVVEKKSTLEKYKFAICYENAKEIPGYITEKIFDCFFAGCVPIYWGADNVAEYIPSDCYIDKTKFNSYESLYDYISCMPEHEYLDYLNAIDCYLHSTQSDGFRAEINAAIIVKETVGE